MLVKHASTAKRIEKKIKINSQNILQFLKMKEIPAIILLVQFAINLTWIILFKYDCF